ncbi:MAG TPA: putative nucleotidyltransferase substrate binding domain-containing protein [Geminicoccaceae bacterium]|nr:putative nucleotidyltransferase substrate binding domain-containing protein [Geminicoccus sp.]HMU51686.1 putative nucleotidyltransferase substrate binding domain-containing protein [Geminicoccaceae bacterium]
MPKAFDFSNPPFDRLRPQEVARVERNVDVVFLRQGATVLRAGDLPDWLFVVIKGAVEERHGGEIVQLHGSGDGFDSEILIHQACRHDFVVREEAICYRLPIEDFIELTANNPAFAAYFLTGISHKLEALAQRGTSPALLGAMTARVADAPLGPATRVTASTTLEQAALRMEESGQRALLVEDGERLGIVTDVDMTRAAFRDRSPPDRPVGEIAHYELETVEAAEPLAEAALQMARRRIRHLVVRDGASVTGVLDAAAVLASLGGQADMVGSLVEQARTPGDLADAGDRLAQLVRQLHGSGTKIGFINSLASELNGRIAARLWAMTVDDELARRSCLLVMGSEGRGEQILRTDQDNGVILEDGFEPADLPATMARFTEAMIACGFPACPGEVMVRNPRWAKPLAAWKADLLHWVTHPGEQALMDMAIFVDARPIAGDDRLLAMAKQRLREVLHGNKLFCRRFAQAIDSFDTPVSLLGRLVTQKGEHEHRLDIKKGGIFPIVHGARALALEQGIDENGTAGRIRRLTELGLFDRQLGVNLADAFSAMLDLRLQARLERMRLHQPLNDLLDPADLSKLERDVLKESLLLAKKLKDIVRNHFQLGMF